MDQAARNTHVLLGPSHHAVKDEMQRFYAGLLALAPEQTDDNRAHVNILDSRDNRAA